jgi:hypothetical protein
MTQATPLRARISERFRCDLPIMACTTLETRPARIVDVSTHGAQVRMDEPYAAGDRIHLDVDGDFVWAHVQWAEIDRIGVKFLAPLQDGHRLDQFMKDQRRQQSMPAPRVEQRSFGFGRRAAA